MRTCDISKLDTIYVRTKSYSCPLAEVLNPTETHKGHSLGIVVSSSLQNVSCTAKLPPYGPHKGSAKTPRVLTRAPSSSVLLSSCCGGRHGRDRQAAKGSGVKLKPHNHQGSAPGVADGGPSLPLLDEGGCEIPQDCLEESPWKSLYFAQKLEAKQKKKRLFLSVASESCPGKHSLSPWIPTAAFSYDSLRMAVQPESALILVSSQAE
ncbi:uncharacterized protein LOC116896315 isoform X2 [Rattus rattus]|uniref:uncharacterized protein LOC116896315 isoform X2 n=1 Tax=Rattus rattus TaxID=10117 RepID=UPI0013F31B4D|nr:uncharacterized protein LOC116896315 isoform X2 [Rattus rattus]